jgi:hypothetical protein
VVALCALAQPLSHGFRHFFDRQVHSHGSAPKQNNGSILEPK